MPGLDRTALASSFLLVQSAAGVAGPSLVGLWFDATGSKCSLFLLLSVFLTGSIVLFATLRRGFGEA